MRREEVKDKMKGDQLVVTVSLVEYLNEKGEILRTEPPNETLAKELDYRILIACRGISPALLDSYALAFVVHPHIRAGESEVLHDVKLGVRLTSAPDEVIASGEENNLRLDEDFSSKVSEMVVRLCVPFFKPPQNTTPH